MIKYKDNKGKIYECKYGHNTQHIDLSNRKIKEIIEIKGLNDLTYLNLSCNHIMEIKGLDSLINLNTLYLNSNKITEIKDLDSLINLSKLFLSSNKISEIKGLDNLIKLTMLYLKANPITKIPLTIMNNKRLYKLCIDCPIDPIIERFLKRNSIKDLKTIYTDPENVHDSRINNSIKESVYKIMSNSKKPSIENVLEEIINDKNLDISTKEQLIEYCEDKTIHYHINLTFDEVLCYIWQAISENKYNVEIKNILNGEMKDSMCICFYGKLSRLVNCLNDFDERVSIKISDKQQILNIIIKIMNTFDDVEVQKKEANTRLLELGYDKKTMDEYLIHLE
jgi:Leucine-rich repeat (LRR) protein